MVEIKHTPTLYVAHADIVRDQSRVTPNMPAIRFQDSGRELAVITLSSYTIGKDTSPEDWAEKLVRACNAHDDLVAALESMLAMYEHVPAGQRKDYIEAYARAALAKAKGGAA